MSLQSYYARRADEYERIYAKPERQVDLAVLEARLPVPFEGRDVLEIACGTGYWTERLARRARSILATDINDEVLAIAQAKSCGPAEVRFERHDVYRMTPSRPLPDGAFAGFWWSHVERARLPGFLDHFHSLLAPGAVVTFLDNRYVEGSSTPIARTDASGDTWQRRSLDDGSMHEVLKNFPTEAELDALLAPHAAEREVVTLEYYWCVRYRLDLPASG